MNKWKKWKNDYYVQCFVPTLSALVTALPCYGALEIVVFDWLIDWNANSWQLVLTQCKLVCFHVLHNLYMPSLFGDQAQTAQVSSVEHGGRLLCSELAREYLICAISVWCIIYCAKISLSEMTQVTSDNKHSRPAAGQHLGNEQQDSKQQIRTQSTFCWQPPPTELHFTPCNVTL